MTSHRAHACRAEAASDASVQRRLVRVAWITWLLAAWAVSAAAQDRPAVGFSVFGDFGYERFAAEQSFQAVLGRAGGGLIGGGGQVRVGGAFLTASIERFTATGQRVIVADDAVFRLGIADTITVTPIAVAAGWRFEHSKATPYFGGGVGRILYKEQARFTEATENVDTRFGSYHALVGVEFRNEWVATAFEVQYTRAPNAIGVGGASAAFRETDLGGITGRIKILVGR